jgi:hypothetical protein
MAIQSAYPARIMLRVTPRDTFTNLPDKKLFSDYPDILCPKQRSEQNDA